MAQILLREHNYRAFSGNLLSIARQTVYLDQAAAVALVNRECGQLRTGHYLEIDTSTNNSLGHSYITDRAFYTLFSDIHYTSIDISAYEGAGIVWDLCQPIPSELEGGFDLIYNGGCLDNIFDPATAIKNMSRMLRPGGRIIHLERASRVHHAYVAYSMAWFHDYYAINDFADCKVYLTLWDRARESPWDVYCYNPLVVQDGRFEFYGQDRLYDPHRQSHVIVVAEKGADLTWHRSPVQFQYRGLDATDPNNVYVRNTARFNRSSRPLLQFPKPVPAQDPQYIPCGAVDVRAELGLSVEVA